MQNYISRVSLLIKERDESRNKLLILQGEMNGLKGEITQITKSKLLMEEDMGYKKKYEEILLSLNRYKNEYDLKVSVIGNLEKDNTLIKSELEKFIERISVLIKERDEARNKMSILNGEMNGMKGEIVKNNNLKLSIEAEIGGYKQKYEELMANYCLLQNEINIKINFINKYEIRIRELEDSRAGYESKINIYISQITLYEQKIREIEDKYSGQINIYLSQIRNNEFKIKELEEKMLSSSAQLNVYATQIRNYEQIVLNLRNEIEELNIRIASFGKKDAEYGRIKSTLPQFKEDWTRLSQSYESLLVDLKNQMEINESLRSIIFDLQGKIESHNQQVGGNDLAIKQQIELLTRQAAVKKSIEYNPNNDLVNRCQNEVQGLRAKVGQIENQQLYKSQAISTLNFNNDFDYVSNPRNDQFVGQSLSNSRNTQIIGQGFNNARIEQNVGQGLNNPRIEQYMGQALNYGRDRKSFIGQNNQGYNTNNLNVEFRPTP